MGRARKLPLHRSAHDSTLKIYQMKTLPAILLTLAVAVPVTWFATQKFHSGGASSAASSTQPAGRKLLYYQSAMHPWIKSPKAVVAPSAAWN